MREVTMPSGATLVVNAAPFFDSKNLFQAILRELPRSSVKTLPGDDIDVLNGLKDMICMVMSSKEVEACLWVCMARCKYNGLKVVPETFEPENARCDFTDVCVEVAKENIHPFFEKPLCKVRTAPRKSESKEPSIEVKDDVLLTYFKLCKEGYASSIKEASEMDARSVIQALAYESFLQDYQVAYRELNQ